ncbi:UNVERIFIED_CONTAM: hypothetical protein K2H54_060540 [Gekko kuhli]
MLGLSYGNVLALGGGGLYPATGKHLSTKMSGEEGHEPPASTTETTPVTMAFAPVSMPPPGNIGGGMFLRHLYPVPCYTPQAPQYLSGIRGLHGTTPLRWDHFNVESMQETYLLTQGPRRESLFDMGTSQGFGGQTLGPSGVGGATADQAWITERLKECKDYLLAAEDEEEDEVEQRLGVLKRAQGKFHQDLEEVIQAIPDTVVRALQAERGAQPALVQRDAPAGPAPDQRPPVHVH